jgi:hypothetical protein
MKIKIIRLLGNLIRNKNTDRLEELVKEHLPHGSGFDSGTVILSATKERITFQADFHHMNDAGYYDGWTEHKIIVTPDFELGYTLKVTGKDKNGIKDYIKDTFYSVLNMEIENEARWFN